MAYRFRGRGQFSTPASRSGKSFTYDGRRVLLREGNFELTWNGPGVVKAVLDALSDSFSQLSDEALTYMQSIVPVDTGATQASCFAIVEVVGGRIQLTIGAGTPYAIYIELGTSSHAAHPFIRPTFDLVIRELPGILKKEVSRRVS